MILMDNKDEFIKIDKSGCVVIPASIRNDMDINDETLLRIDYDSSEKTISFSKAYNNCYECGSPMGIIPFGSKKKICCDCLGKMIQEITEGKRIGKKDI